MSWKTVVRTQADRLSDDWSGLVFSTYPPDAARVMSTRKDPFANPLGATVRRATRATLEALARDDDKGLADALHDLVRIRAVQDFSPSQAVAVVFLLKRVIREALGDGASPLTPSDLADFDRRVDEITLTAFDLYVADRERIAEIRIREHRRRVQRLLERAGIRGDDPDDSDRASPSEATT